MNSLVWLSRRHRTAARLVLLLSSTLLPGAAYAHSTVAAQPIELAKDPSAAAPTAAAAKPTGGLEEIVVTARKRTERLQDVPASITAYTAQDLQKNDLSSIERVAAKTPELVVARASTGSGAQLSLRGVGSNFTSVGIEQSVAVIIDGSYYGQGRVINEGLFDLAGIEVLKGPQALFFGKNATAGVISVTTADPGPSFESYLRTGYGLEARELYGEGMVSVPISETLGVRLSVRGTDMFGGYFKNLGAAGVYNTLDTATGFSSHSYPSTVARRNAPALKELVGRLTVKWTPTERLKVTLKGYGSNSHAEPAGWNNVPLCPPGATSVFNNPNIPCKHSFNIYQTNLPAAIAAVTTGAKDGILFDHYRSYALNGTINYNLPHLSITSVSNYNYNKNSLLADYSYESVSANWAPEISSWKAYSNETRALTSFHGPLNFLIGLYYQHTQRDFLQIPIFGGPLGLENSAAPAGYRYASTVKLSHTTGETTSGYAQAIWKVVPSVELTAGGRYIHETKVSDFDQVYTNPGFAGTFVPNEPVFANQKFNKFSPEVTLTWKPDQNLTIYGAYKTGYKSGGFSNGSIVGPTTKPGDLAFGPESARGFEGGIKAALLDHQLRIELNAYRYTYSGLQVDFFNSQTISYVTTNAGSARTKGIEASFEAAPRSVAGLTIRGALNYNLSRYVHFFGPCYGGQSQVEGCVYGDFLGNPPAGGALPQFQNLAGVPTANAPKWTGSLGGEYEHAVGGGLVMGVSADARYSSSYFASGFGNPVSKQHSYVNLDGAVRLHTPDDRWEIALIGKNLTNQFIITGAYDITFTGQPTGSPLPGRLGDQAGSIALPRNIQLQLTWRY